MLNLRHRINILQHLPPQQETEEDLLVSLTNNEYQNDSVNKLSISRITKFLGHFV